MTQPFKYRFPFLVALLGLLLVPLWLLAEPVPGRDDRLVEETSGVDPGSRAFRPAGAGSGAAGLFS